MYYRHLNIINAKHNITGNNHYKHFTCYKHYKHNTLSHVFVGPLKSEGFEEFV